MLKLKLQSFSRLIRRAYSLEKTLMLGKTEGRRRTRQQRRDDWMVSSTQWTWVWANSGRQWRTGDPGVLQSMGSQRARHNLMTEQQKQQLSSIQGSYLAHYAGSFAIHSLLPLETSWLCRTGSCASSHLVSKAFAPWPGREAQGKEAELAEVLLLKK